jgi:hypothetical protein
VKRQGALIDWDWKNAPTTGDLVKLSEKLLQLEDESDRAAERQRIYRLEQNFGHTYALRLVDGPPLRQGGGVYASARLESLTKVGDSLPSVDTTAGGNVDPVRRLCRQRQNIDFASDRVALSEALQHGETWLS